MDDLLRAMLSARASCGIASGEFLDAPDCEEPGVLTLVSALRAAERWRFFGNVSRQSATFSPRFSRWTQASERRDLLSGSAVPEKRNDAASPLLARRAAALTQTDSERA